METWSSTNHSIADFRRTEIVLEPRVGGRWLERGPKGEECQWGGVEACRIRRTDSADLAAQVQGVRVFDPDLVTEVEITFTPQEGGRTKVDLEHRNLERMGAKAETVRGMIDAPGGWMSLLEAFGARVVSSGKV